MRPIAAALLLGSLAGASWAQEAGAPRPAAKGVNFYSLEKERQLGQQLASRMAGSLPLVHEPKLDAYVAQLGAVLAKYAKAPFDYSFTFYEDRKLPQESPAGVFSGPAAGGVMPVDALRGPAGEPVAVAGGPIFIPMSLLADAPSEAVFAFELAHAMAHTAMRHQTRLATKTELTELAGVAGQVQGSPVSNNSAAANRQTATLPQLTFARAAEREADYTAVQIVAKAGYDPLAMADYVSGQPAPAGPAASSPHPLPGHRAGAIREEIARLLPNGTYGASTGGFAEAKKLAATVR